MSQQKNGAAPKPEARILQILSAYDLDSSSIWQVRGGNFAIYHKAIEIIQAKEEIVFDPPEIIHDGANERKEIVLRIVGYKNKDMKDERSEWSFGECSPGNNKNAYPWAMAEKRGKDRVILKLINLAGMLYSEDEADDFKRQDPEYNAKTGKRTSASLKRDTDENGKDPYQRFVEKIDELAAKGPITVQEFWENDKVQAQIVDWPQAWRDEAQGYYETTMETLVSGKAAQ